MDIESVSSRLHEFGKLRSWLDDVESKLWEIFLTQFYRTIPHQEGTLDEHLQSNLKNGLLFVGVRFRAFNNSVGFLIKWASYLTAVALVIILSIVSYSATPVGGPLGAILSALIFIGGVGLLVSLGAVLIADILLIFYLASLARYGVKRVRSSLSTRNKSNLKVYSCEVIDSVDSTGSTITLYKSNFEAFYRMVIYILASIILLALYLLPSPIIEKSKGVFNTAMVVNISQVSSIPEMNGIVKSIDAIVPIDLLTLFEPESLPFIKTLTLGILLFSAFLNWKRISHHAIRSQFEWSEYDSFNWWKECKDCWSVAKIAFYHFLIGDLSKEFRVVRGQIIYSIFVVFVAMLITYLFLIFTLTSL